MDDEQGTGLLDTQRALIQHQGGKQVPGPVSKIGWDVNQTSPAGGDRVYTINAQLTRGQFLTVTLVWDRILDEVDGDFVVEANDTYPDHPWGANDPGVLPDFNLFVYRGTPGQGGQLVAQSVASAGGAGLDGENVEHLHFPVPADGNDYNIRVSLNGPADVTKAYAYAVAWWGPG